MNLRNAYHHQLRRLIKTTFILWEKLGIHITPAHFYEPVPILGNLKDSIWERDTQLLGISMNEAYQLSFLRDICSTYQDEYNRFGLYQAEGDCSYFVHNGTFGEIDGDVLYSIIRHFRPSKIIEVGAGWSTILSSYTLNINKLETGKPYELIAIEPHSNEILKGASLGKSKLIEKELQAVDIALFSTLEENDILFLDSSHIVNIGSDVCWAFLEILPRLKKGVLVHIHDIFLPNEYPKEWVKDDKRFWNEAYLLQAFLMYNQAFEIVWAGNWMKTKYPDLCRKRFRGSASQSFWIRKAI